MDGEARQWRGTSPQARRVRAWIARAAPLDATALITGETGTGKGLVARALHEGSPRRAAPFLHVDAGALAEGVFQSELFGHERGAFTGAAVRRIGRFEAAAGGTIFLDEIGELAAASQARLLRVLQERVFERVGGTIPLHLEARVVAATTLPLEKAVATGRFRADLFHRLDVLRLHLPPLRERSQDVPELVDVCLAEVAARMGRPKPGVAGDLAVELAARPWPGNIRELQNLVERLLVWSPGSVLRVRDLARVEGAPPIPVRAAGSLEATLRETGGNVSRAARRLGIPRTTLRRRIRAESLHHLIPKD